MSAKKSKQRRFDVFISYNRQDESLVRQIVEQLEKRGIKPWLDSDEIPPGQPFQDFLQKGISEIKSAAIFIGPNGIGKWQQLELKSFIAKSVENGIPVIPVLLPNVSDLPANLVFLKQFSWVKFREGALEQENLDRLAWGITAERKNPVSSNGAEHSSSFVKNESVPPVTELSTKERKPGRPEKVIYGLHGIRTHAEWSQPLFEILGPEGWQLRMHRWNFGYFSLFSFLSPWARFAKVRWFREVYRDEKNDRTVLLEDHQLPSIVAHSFGTFILGNALLRYKWLKFNKVLLCGSILPCDFPWDKLIERGQVQAVRNEFGAEDIWTRVVGWFVACSGPSGRSGFTCKHQRFEQERFDYTHSEYFEKGHMTEKWLPFLSKELSLQTQAEVDVLPPKRTRPWGLFAFMVLLLALVAFSLVLISNLTGGKRDHEESSADSKELKIEQLLNAFDAARDGDEMGAAVREAKSSPNKSEVINRLKLSAASRNARRLSALLLLTAPETEEMRALFRNNANRELQTAVLVVIADVSATESADLEKWFIKSLEQVDETSSDIGYCLGLCLGMAYDGSGPRHRTAPGTAFLETVRKKYRTHPDAGIHSVLRVLLLNSGGLPNLNELDRSLVAERNEQTVLDELMKDKRTPRQRPTWFATESGVTMVVIPPGSFKVSVPEGWKADLGSPIPSNAAGHVDHWFAISPLEVSNSEFSTYVDQLADDAKKEVLQSRNTHKGKVEAWIDAPSAPATRVSWFYAADYCTWLTDLEIKNRGRAEIGQDKKRRFTEHELNLSVRESIAYRLPLEEEWEYACRAESTTSRFFGEEAKFLDKFAWFGAGAEESGTGEGVPRVVGSKLPNRWGLFDVYGNADEWCMNTWRVDFTTDLSGIWIPYRMGAGLFERPFRGGSCGGYGGSLFSSFRQGASEQKNHAPKYGGFRVARTFLLRGS